MKCATKRIYITHLRPVATLLWEIKNSYFLQEFKGGNFFETQCIGTISP